MRVTNALRPCLLLLARLACGSALAPNSASQSARSGATPPAGSGGRRAFLAAALTAGTASAAAPPARAWPFFAIAPAAAQCTYDEFRGLLADGALRAVEFGSDGVSLVCLDDRDVLRAVQDLPDDRNLLTDLVERRVDVTLQEYKFTKQMNSANFVKDLLGGDLTDEELYAYRGYKTYRSSPGQGNIPSGLISGLSAPR